MRVSVAASTRNWNMISPRVAPSAFRTPISRVRSVTEIIMIATTPTPPTIRRDARERDHHDEEAGGDLVEGLDHAILRDDREIVRLRSAGARASPAARR